MGGSKGKGKTKMGLVIDRSDIMRSPGEKVGPLDSYSKISPSCIYVYFYDSMLLFLAKIYIVSYDSEPQEWLLRMDSRNPL